MSARSEHPPWGTDSYAANTPATRWHSVRSSDFRRLRSAAGAVIRIQLQEMQAVAVPRRPVRGLSEDFLLLFRWLLSLLWRRRRCSSALSICPARLEVAGACALRSPA